jgi:hypothetical protein
MVDTADAKTTARRWRGQLVPLRARLDAATRRIPRRWLRVGLALATAALLFVVAERARSSFPSFGQLRRPDLGWLAVAVLAELASLAAYVLIVRELLALGKVVARLGALLRTTVGGIAMTASLPGGPAVSAAYWYRQLRLQGADGGLAGLAMAGSMVAGVLSLGGLLVAGVAIAGEAGPLAALRLPILTAAAVVPAVLLLLRRHIARASQPLFARFAPALTNRVSVGRRSLLTIGALAVANWILDCASLYAALAAVHAEVPPRSILLTYAIAQLVASLPLLPGGGGSVELSLAIGFAAFGHTSGNLIAGILLFRVISCWGLVPIGWVAVALERRRAPTVGKGPLPQPAPLPCG